MHIGDTSKSFNAFKKIQLFYGLKKKMKEYNVKVIQLSGEDFSSGSGNIKRKCFCKNKLNFFLV